MTRPELLAHVCVSIIETMPNATPEAKALSAVAKLREAEELIARIEASRQEDPLPSGPRSDDVEKIAELIQAHPRWDGEIDYARDLADTILQYSITHTLKKPDSPVEIHDREAAREIMVTAVCDEMNHGENYRRYLKGILTLREIAELAADAILDALEGGVR